MASIKHDLLTIHYEWMESDKPDAEDTVILIHGLGLDIYSWDYAVPYLRKNYHIMRYDLRGHGASDAGSGVGTMNLLRDDLLLLLTELDIKSYHIIGHGLGGFSGVYLASEKAPGLKSLVLMSVPLHYPKNLGNKVTDERKKAVIGQQTMINLGEQLKNNAFHLPTEEKKYILMNAFKKVSPAVYFDIFHIDNLKSGIERLRQITVPILLLSGAEDAMFPPELSSASLNFNTNARHYTVPDASFMIQMDQPQVMTQWIHNFIQKNDQDKWTNTYDDNYQESLTAEMYTEIRGILQKTQNSASPVNNLQVNMMNGFNAHINGERILKGWGQRKAKQLLAYLVLQPSTTREELCDVFWPEVDLETAKNRLRVSLHHLKQLLTVNTTEKKTHLLVTEREHVFLQAKVQSDLLHYRKAVKMAHRLESITEKTDEYKRLLREEKENIIPGFFEDWFLDQRTGIENEWADMALFLVDLYEKQNDVQNAVHYLKIALKYHNDAYTLQERLDRLEGRMA
ncbi:alpha/beta hydrolase [Lentibacillus sp. Marseille-P4043]|uniref:alpha/beta hydrolase n=1 Tax=Lentibacillus sp. Marseille-P4043 TaxID=2040293 RepID=UPI00131A5B59|nr:alpha/beta hydrolase [Lentibacillus sp. Marseille-P4043]